MNMHIYVYTYMSDQLVGDLDRVDSDMLIV